MKKIILSSIFFFLFFQNGVSQNTPRIQKYTKSYKSNTMEPFKVNEENIYEYDFDGNLSLREIKYFNFDGSISHWQGEFYDYYPNQLLKKKSFKRYNPNVDLWITEDFIEYKYDSNNCLIEKTFIENIGGKIKKKENYVVIEDCQWVLKEISTPEWSNDTLITPSHYFERDYFPDGISFLEEYYYYFSNGDSSAVDRWFFLIFNEEGNEIERHNIYTHTQHTGYIEEKFTTDYDQFGNKTLKSKSERELDTADWDLKYIVDYDNLYNDNNFLIEANEELNSYSTGTPILNANSVKTKIFMNSCEGIPEVVYTKYVESGGFGKEQFLYEGINECIDLDEIYLNIQVWPNPSNGNFKILSPIFQTGDTEIHVYSIDGRVLLHKLENSRSDFSNIDLSFLQNGFYFLQLRNGNHFVKSKIIIAK